jgi:hypothetical protein
MTMRSTHSLAFAFLAATVSACSSTPAQDDAESADKVSATEEFRLPGFDETILTAEETGKVAVMHVGNSWSKKDVQTSHDRLPTIARSHDGKFHLLYGDALVIVNPTSGAVDRTMPLTVSDAADFEFSDKTIYLSDAKTAKVVAIDANTGAERASIDLAALRREGGSVEPHRLLAVGNRLFVQVARSNAAHRKDQGAVAVIDTTKNTVEKTIELSFDNRSGLEPDLPMALDTKRNQVFVTALGDRPRDTGMLFRVNVADLTIHDVKKAESGFQGAISFREPFSDFFMIYHTSTPTTSTHLFTGSVDNAGKLDVPAQKTLVDAFDGLDAMDINQRGTLVALANICATGFCIKGAGVNFVDAKSKAVLPKLLAAQIGFEPEMVVFK